MTPAENAWKAAMEAAAVWHDAQADEYDAQYESRRGRAMPIIINASAHRSSARTLRSLPMPPAFRAEVEAEAEELREGLRNIAVVGFSDDPKVNAAIARQCVEQARALLSRLEAKGESHE